MRSPGPGRVLPAAALVAALAAGLGGCGTASAPSPPTGLDGLVIPTPSPAPEDFVADVDNPWFPLPAGHTWTYDVIDGADLTRGHRMVVTVAEGPAIAGVPTTARVVRERGRTVTDWYAQDAAGNVWWFGREGEWRAGDDGARAGVAMLAAPRVGDGYRTAYAAGVIEEHATVTSVEDDEVVIAVERTSPTPSEVKVTYVDDVGLVEAASTGGSYRVVRLRAVTGSD